MKVLVIAEAGVNHNGDLVLAKKLIDAAKAAGANFAKFQTFRADRLATDTAVKAGYQSQRTDSNESQLEMLRRLELTDDMHCELIGYCQQADVDFLSSGFDIESIDFLNSLGLKLFKIPSGEITNLPYLRHVGSLEKEVILSSGMATMGEIEAAITVIEQAGTPRSNITVLHCTTEYPTLMADVNLSAMCRIGDAFGVRVGYSDHTPGTEVAIAAVALGATVIEKHFTLDRNLPGPDHQASLEPEELKLMIASIRNIEVALGDGIKRPTSSEQKNKDVVRKSIVASCSIREGEIFTSTNVTTKRPGIGISPMLWDHVLGRVSRRDFQPDELIEL
ncbi:MAG: N-acetylneuraminate synthase [Verrucomicrobiae bacterium]|nr:N-acetylneuraminate synthase [Verrucomicrobiae bacterium]